MKHLVTPIVLVLAFACCCIQAQYNCPIVNSGDNCYFNGIASSPPTGANANEYYTIGGLFDVHDKGTDAYTCDDAISDKAILNVLAFFWAVGNFGKVTNQNGVSIGAFAFDNCYRPEQTIENLLGFSQCKLFLKGIRENVVAYVGPYENDDAIRTGRLASELSKPLVSPDANSYELNEQEHRYLLRVRPSFDEDLKAIMSFLQYTGSKHVLVVYSDDQFYKDAHESLMKMLGQHDICTNRNLMVSDFDAAQWQAFVDEQLASQGRVKYLVPLMSPTQVRELMGAISSNPNINDKIVYILNSQVGQNRGVTTDKVIVVEPKQDINLSLFNDALKAIRLNSTINGNVGLRNLDNPWLSEYLAQASDKEIPILDDGVLPTGVILSVSRTITAVKDIITGMDNAMRQLCSPVSSNNYQMCGSLRNPKEAIANILNTIESEVHTNDKYEYFTFKNNDNTFFKFGEYDTATNTQTLNIPAGIKTWFEESMTASACPDDKDCCVQTTVAPVTTEKTVPTSETPPPTESPDDIEVKYPRGQEITGAFSLDGPKGKRYDTRFDEGHKWVIALGVLAGLGVLCVLVFEIYIMYKLMGTHMASKWRTMWLGQLLLFGVLLAYLTLIAFIFVPTDATCGITRFGVGVSYAICYAVLLVKLMVILTSKSSDVLLPGDGDSPNYLRGVYQFLMFIFAVGVQVVINVQWLITVPPEAVQVTTRTGGKAWVCNHYTWEVGKDMFTMEDFVRTNFENHLLSLVYIMALILVITILSLNAHGIITNHRESVFIGIASGFSIPLWLAWALVGGLNKDNDYAHEFGDACIAFGLLVNVTLILFAMFLPKVRQLVNMGVEGIYLEDDRDTYYAGSVIMAPPSYKSKGPSSVIYVNNQGIYSEPVVIGNGDHKGSMRSTHLKHPGSTYSAPPAFIKKSESTYGGSRVLKMTDDLKGRHPQKKTQSEVNYGNSIRSRSYKGTLPRSRSYSDIGAL